jgi:hypothetical protein
MAYIFQMRRGVRHVNANGETLKNADGAPIRDDWGAWADKKGLPPQEGEIVVEFEYNPETNKTLPRLKIGDGHSAFADLEYIGLESFIIPTGAPVHNTVTLKPKDWAADTDDSGNVIADRYYQKLDLEVTANSKVDIQLSPEELSMFKEKKVTFTTVNRGGNVKIYAIGQQPEQEHTIHVTITEVS